MYDSCYRTASQNVGVVGSIIGAGGNKDSNSASLKDGRPQHIILMEYCEGGHALDVCNKLADAGQRFDLSALIIASDKFAMLFLFARTATTNCSSRSQARQFLGQERSLQAL
jgi:hypothetical protein